MNSLKYGLSRSENCTLSCSCRIRILPRAFFIVLILFLASCVTPQTANQDGLPDQAEAAMLEATRFMVEQVSTNGGYVRAYLPDLSRRWAEVEVWETQIWIEANWGGGGTPGIGQLFLDAYELTGEPYYYQAAMRAAGALAWGQHESGGWNYLVDFAGDRSLKEWYATIGKNAWGFEEHNHYYGNATFDDNVTTGAADFLLRLYLEKLDPAVKVTLDKAIDFIHESQYPLGGWPQRYPLMYDYSKGGKEDYTHFYTFNDDVNYNNVLFLVKAYQSLGEERLLDPIRRGMNFFLVTQQGNPQGGWGKQYTMELEPAHARSYEPAALVTRRSYENGEALMDFYELTGDRKFLARIPDLINWLDSVRLPEEVIRRENRTHPFFVEIGTNRALYYHRRGSGVTDEQYWIDYNSGNAYSYGLSNRLDMVAFIERFERLQGTTPDQVVTGSPLRIERVDQLPDPYPLQERLAGSQPSGNEVRRVIEALDDQGRWLTTGEWVSDPFRVDAYGNPSNTALHADPITARGIRDQSDQLYISMQTFANNMNLLMRYIHNR